MLGVRRVFLYVVSLALTPDFHSTLTLHRFYCRTRSCFPVILGGAQLKLRRPKELQPEVTRRFDDSVGVLNRYVLCCYSGVVAFPVAPISIDMRGGQEALCLRQIERAIRSAAGLI